MPNDGDLFWLTHQRYGFVPNFDPFIWPDVNNECDFCFPDHKKNSRSWRFCI